MITIITSLYNSAAHLDTYAKHIENVSAELTKKGVEHEMLIIPNSPNEEEKPKLKKIEENKNIKSRILVCERESLYATWNRGVREAKYPTITFWNVDDIRFSKAIEDGLKKIQAGSDIIYFPYLYKRYVKVLGIKILAKIKIVKAATFDRDLFTKGMYAGPFFMLKKEAFGKAGFFDESFRIAGDFDWMVKAAKAGLMFEKSDALAGIFTNDGTTLSGSRSDLQQQENNRILGIL